VDLSKAVFFKLRMSSEWVLFGGAFYAPFVLLINAEMIFPNVLEEFLPPLYSSLLHSFIFVVSFSFTFCAFFVYVFFLLSIVLVKRNNFDPKL